jgi:hypothetical protein
MKSSLQVYVVPVFEFDDTIPPPTTKTQLNENFNRHVFSFHEFKAAECHKIPQLSKWLARTTRSDETVDIFMSTRLVAGRRTGHSESVQMGSTVLGARVHRPRTFNAVV